MRVENLKWLSLLALLGLAGWALDLPYFSGLAGFAAFVPLFWSDERAENNIRRAATVAYTVTLFEFLVVFALVAVGMANNWTESRWITMFGSALGIGYGLSLLTFAFSFMYFEWRGV